MTRAQWGVLVRLERQEGMTQAEMADGLEIQPISLVRLIDRLCQAGLVERRPHPRDRRANRLYLTDKGHATLARLMPLGREISGDVLAAMRDADVLDLLRKLLLHQAQHPPRRRQARGRRQHRCRQRLERPPATGVRVMAVNVSTMLRSSASAGLKAALVAHHADGDPAGAGARHRRLSSTCSAAATCRPTTPMSAPRRC